MKEKHTNEYWSQWTSLSGKQKALLYNPGNILKRKAIINLIFNLNDDKYSNNKNLRILDIGGGLGDLSFEILRKRHDSDIFLVDISRSALMEAKNSLPHCNIIQADGQKLPFKSEIFDMVICSEVLEHLPNDLEALKEIVRVLKKDGRIVITTPFMERFLTRGHLRRYDLASFKRLCDECSLEIKNISFRCRSVCIIRNILRKLLNRKGMGDKESYLYLKVPIISVFIALILKPIDDLLANKHTFPKFMKFLDEATLVVSLKKQRDVQSKQMKIV